MQTRFTGATVYAGGRLCRRDIAIGQGGAVVFSPSIPPEGELAVPLTGKLLIPGFVDVHVHLREPGFFQKETIYSGTRAAARGGYTALCAMPNLDPPPDSPEHLACEQAIIDRDAQVRVYPYGCLTMGRAGGGAPCDYAAMGAVAYSDDGTGVRTESDMRAVMERAAEANALVAAHCEDIALVAGGYIHDGEYCRAHGHRGISAESEWGPIARDLRIAKETGCRYHVCHVSCLESVDLIRRAKDAGADVTCETAPHYLLLCDEDLREDGRFKMNPPLRSRADRDALVAAARDGTIDMIATDHAPHTPAEKSRGLEHSAMGVTGLECAFGALYAGLVLPGRLTLERLLAMMTDAPRRRFGLPEMDFSPGQAADMAALDLSAEWTIDPDAFESKGKATPFAGAKAAGRCDWTMVGGRTVWRR